MNREALLALADRCEKAGVEEQWELILEARRLIDPFGFVHDCGKRAMSRCETCEQFTAKLDAQAFESAALMLVPEGWWIERFTDRAGAIAPCYARLRTGARQLAALKQEKNNDYPRHHHN